MDKNGILLLSVVVLVSVIGLALSSQSYTGMSYYQDIINKPVIKSTLSPWQQPVQAPYIGADEWTLMCEQEYQFRVQLCNNRQTPAANVTCQAQTEALRQECLALA